MNRREWLRTALSLLSATAVSPRVARASPGPTDLIVRRIPSSGEEIPVIGLGTSGPFEVGEARAERAPLAEVLEAFFAAGARLIDTSPMYSTAERVLGELLTDSMRRHAFIATKVWTRGERAGIEQMTQSAQLLRREHLDLIQVHNLLDLDTQLRTLHSWKEAGRVRYVGVTHYTVSAQAELERGVAVLVNRPFEDGALFGPVHGRKLPPWAAELDAASWGQLALKFIASHPAVTCIIPATGKVAHLEDNLAGGRGRLPDARQREAIAQAFG